MALLPLDPQDRLSHMLLDIFMSNKVLSLAGKQAMVVSFYPPKWGEIDRFHYFHSTTYKFNERICDVLRGVGSHFHKALVLQELAESLGPELKKDREELEARGYTGNHNGARLAAVGETIFCEFYSCVDCTRQVVADIYGNFQGVTSKSTRRFFQNAAEGKLDPRLPQLIREAFVNAGWYHKLRKVRDAVTHSDVGSCHSDKSGKIGYFNAAAKIDGKCFTLPDVFLKIRETEKAVNQFCGQIFHHLNSTLKDEEVFQVCGFFNGRCYSRFVRPSEAVDFHSGRCDAYTWFEKDGHPRCPYAEKCGAYTRAKKATG